MSLNLTAGTYVAGFCNLTIKKPDGTTLTTAYGSCSGSTGYVDTVTLTQTGTHTIFIDPQGPGTGGVTVQINGDPDVTGTITPGGSAVTVTTTAPGQDARLTFTGTANQRVSLLATNVTYSAYVNLVQPNGTTQTTMLIASGCGTSSVCFMDTQVLATAGTYTLWVQHTGTGFGSATLQMYNVPADATGTVTIGGSATSISTTVPGQNASLTFSGTSGQKVSLSLSSGTYPGGFCNLTLKNPDGTTLTTGYGSCSGSTGFVDALALPQTGTYTIFIDPQSNKTGGVTTAVNNDADVTGTITIGGAGVTFTTSVPGHNALYTFTGNSGQSVTVHLTSNTFGVVTVSLINPSGSTLTSTSLSASSFNLTSETLSTTGTYTVKVDPSGSNTGSITVNVTSP